MQLASATKQLHVVAVVGAVAVAVLLVHDCERARYAAESAESACAEQRQRLRGMWSCLVSSA